MNKNNQKSDRALSEEKILNFWQSEKIFEKTLAKKNKGDFVFYDGPPFANGLPHYGHLLTSYIKDTIPRYKTMQGFRVPRRWGWDCHGLPVENEVEKNLGLKGKNEILDYGVQKFNETARKSVLTYADTWRETIKRIGRFIDMENDYRTMDFSYTESIWWAFKNLYDKSLIYEGFKSMHLCPRCETTLSNFEVSQGYKDVTDLSVTVKFELLENFGFERVYALAWTTTPWTLPGNFALAINKEQNYVFVKKDNVVYVLAEKRVKEIFKEENIQILKTILGIDLVGKQYKPVFDDFYNDKNLIGRDKAWKIYAGDFVTMEDGTGIVHIAPAFGEDDLNLAKKEGIPILSHIDTNGKIKSGVLTGKFAKPKETPDSTDIEVIKYLAGEEKLFAKEKIKHSYPHCWRCESPLLNFATSSWFVKVTDLKNKLVSENKKINWVPKDVGEGRFGNWLENSRDWAISRSRFWGAPIPVWKCDKCQKIKVVGSVSEIEGKAKNKFILMRHGEAENNTLRVLSGLLTNIHTLTEKGKAQAKKSAEQLKSEDIDLIFYSPIRRTRETAMIVKEVLGLSDERVISDDRLRETNFGNLEGKSLEEYWRLVGPDFGEKRSEDYLTVEGRASIRKRMIDFIMEVENKYTDKTILIISHDKPLWVLEGGAEGLQDKQVCKNRERKGESGFKNAEFKKVDLKILPRSEFGEPDLHRPYIDNYPVFCDCGNKMKRVQEVLDCWFESGAMPFASNHYPFENHNFAPARYFWQKNKGFPADFIAEGLDQTRGWFYSLLVLSVALFGQSPFKNVIVNGIILAENGEKMSKRLKNYPDPKDILDKYGSDSLRFYLLSSPIVRAESLKFSESGVDEIQKKIINRFKNVFSFLEMYAENTNFSNFKFDDIENKLNLWIIARLVETIKQVENSMNKYELDRATRPLADFVDDLSVWYLRRSRQIFKTGSAREKKEAFFVLNLIIKEFTKVLAPFMPFFSEELFLDMRNDHDEISVHLSAWPLPNKDLEDKLDLALIKTMAQIRDLASRCLEMRAKLKIKVRQPLGLIKVKDGEFLKDKDLVAILLDEINVKNIEVDPKMKDEIYLDSNLTQDLKEEGMMRELTRSIQDLRKRANLGVNDFVDLELEVKSGDKKFIENIIQKIAKNTNLSKVMFSSNVLGEELELYDGLRVSLKLIK